MGNSVSDWNLANVVDAKKDGQESGSTTVSYAYPRINKGPNSQALATSTGVYELAVSLGSASDAILIYDVTCNSDNSFFVGLVINDPSLNSETQICLQNAGYAIFSPDPGYTPGDFAYINVTTGQLTLFSSSSGVASSTFKFIGRVVASNTVAFLTM